MTDDYEILPSDEVEYLRREIEKIKAKPFGADTDTLIGSIRQLQSSIDALVKIFAEANSIVSASDFRPPSASTVTNDSGVLSRLELQNEKIAKSIINLANNIKSQENQHQREHQEFLKKKETKPTPQVNSGIIPSGLAPLSMASKQAEHDKQLPNIPEQRSQSPINASNPTPAKPKDSKFSFSKGGVNGENTDELPEPPKPMY